MILWLFFLFLFQDWSDKDHCRENKYGAPSTISAHSNKILVNKLHLEWYTTYIAHMFLTLIAVVHML